MYKFYNEGTEIMLNKNIIDNIINFKRDEIITNNFLINGFINVKYINDKIKYNFKIKIKNNIVQEEFYFPLFHDSMNKKVFLIAVYQKNDDYMTNVLYFIKNGIKNDIDYLFIINGDISFENMFPKSTNVFILKRMNEGFDFGAYSLGIQLLKHKKYDYNFFMNSSTIGPIIPPYIDFSFDQIFINQFKNNVHLISPTIIIVEKDNPYLKPSLSLLEYKKEMYPMCQSFMFVLDLFAMDILGKHNFFDYYYGTSLIDVVLYKENLLTLLLLHNNCNIGCLLPEFRDVNFLNIVKNIYSFENNYIPIVQNQMFKRTMHPYDVIFHKNNRALNTESVNSLVNSKIINNFFLNNWNWKIYRELNTDLIKAGLNTETQIVNHWNRYGYKENRRTKITDLISDFNLEKYKEIHPDLKLNNQVEYELYCIRKVKDKQK